LTTLPQSANASSKSRPLKQGAIPAHKTIETFNYGVCLLQFAAQPTEEAKSRWDSASAIIALCVRDNKIKSMLKSSCPTFVLADT
jgi:hypothetical protein